MTRKRIDGRAQRDLQLFQGTTASIRYLNLIGDRYLDVQAAHSAGVRTVLVRSGDGAGEVAKYADQAVPQPIHVADNLLSAVEAILSWQVA